MTKPRYTQQHNTWDCGAAAIANGCKWAGINFSYKRHRAFLMKKLKIVDATGVHTHDLVDFINKTNLPFAIKSLKRRATAKTIGNCIKRGNAVILFYWQRLTDIGHVFLVIGKKGNKYQAVNMATGMKTIAYFPTKYFKNNFVIEIEKVI